MSRSGTTPAPRRRTVRPTLEPAASAQATGGEAPLRSSAGAIPVAPYAPSWLNRLIDWIDRQPGPAWVYYAASVLLLGVLSWLTQRLAAEVSPETFDPQSLVFALYPAYILGLTHYLDRQALSSLEAFRPALEVGEADFARIQYELTTVPATGAWIATSLAVPLTYAFIVAPQPADLSAQAIPGEVLAFLMTAFTTATFLILVLHSIRQLRKVSELHAAASNINLLQPRPTYAFSRLTSRSTLGVLLFLYLDFIINPPVGGSAGPYFVLLAVTLVVEAGAFLLPLLGMHQRLTREKAQLEAEVNSSVELAYRAFQQEVRSERFDRLNELDKALSGLLRMREVIGKLSTWPRQPETLRWMLAAIILPLALRLAQSALEGLLG